MSRAGELAGWEPNDKVIRAGVKTRLPPIPKPTVAQRRQAQRVLGAYALDQPGGEDEQVAWLRDVIEALGLKERIEV